MASLPSLIINYLNDPLLYNKSIEQNKLSYLCLTKLLDIYPPLKQELTIEELIDFHDYGSIILSYVLVSQLNLLQLPELFEPLVLLFNRQLENYIDNVLTILTESKALATCLYCDRLLLIPSKYYYYVCQYCNNDEYRQSKYNYFYCRSFQEEENDGSLCEECHNKLTYYIIVGNLKFKLSRDSDRDIYDQQGIKADNNLNTMYHCIFSCYRFDVEENVLQLYDKYNNLIFS